MREALAQVERVSVGPAHRRQLLQGWANEYLDEIVADIAAATPALSEDRPDHWPLVKGTSFVCVLDHEDWPCSAVQALSEDRLPAGMRLVPGPVGSCQWAAHHWIKDRFDQTICEACNARIEPIPVSKLTVEQLTEAILVASGQKSLKRRPDDAFEWYDSADWMAKDILAVLEVVREDR